MDEAGANASLDNDYGDGHGAAAPATHYLAFFRDATWLEELTGASLPRVPMANTSANWPDAVGGVKGNGQTPTSDPSTAPWPYDATAWALMSDPAGGFRGDGGELPDPVSNDAAGTVISLDPGTLTISYHLD